MSTAVLYRVIRILWNVNRTAFLWSAFAEIVGAFLYPPLILSIRQMFVKLGNIEENVDAVNLMLTFTALLMVLLGQQVVLAFLETNLVVLAQQRRRHMRGSAFARFLVYNGR